MNEKGKLLRFLRTLPFPILLLRRADIACDLSSPCSHSRSLEVGSRIQDASCRPSFLSCEEGVKELRSNVDEY